MKIHIHMEEVKSLMPRIDFYMSYGSASIYTISKVHWSSFAVVKGMVLRQRYNFPVSHLTAPPGPVTADFKHYF
jgi:hypothetical protein